MPTQCIEQKLTILHRFEEIYPDQIASRLQKNHKKLDAAFVKGRDVKHPAPPGTATDPAVCLILEKYFGYAPTTLDELIKSHKDAMAAENIVGELLERFLAEILEPHGWLWCSGSVVKSVDFVKEMPTGEWVLLQIKNRDNSENSSSQSVRNGTSIQKWFRAFSRKQEFNWSAFPLAPNDPPELKNQLTETKFREFIKRIMGTMKNA